MLLSTVKMKKMIMDLPWGCKQLQWSSKTFESEKKNAESYMSILIIKNVMSVCHLSLHFVIKTRSNH